MGVVSKGSSGYLVKDFGNFPRVTNITAHGSGSSGTNALMGWVQKLAVSAAKELPQEDYLTKSVWGDNLSARITQDRKAAAQAGTETHKAIEMHLAGEEVPELYQVSSARAERALHDTIGEVGTMHTEVVVFNEDLGYAGQVDLAVEEQSLLGSYHLADWKTGKYLYTTMLLQAVAYLKATHWIIDEEVIKAPPVVADHIIQVRHDKLRVETLWDDSETASEAWLAFMACLEVYEWNQKNGSDFL